MLRTKVVACVQGVGEIRCKLSSIELLVSLLDLDWKKIPCIDALDYRITLRNSLAFSTIARSFGSDNNRLPFSFSDNSFFSVNCATDDGSKLSKSFLTWGSNGKNQTKGLNGIFFLSKLMLINKKWRITYLKVSLIWRIVGQLISANACEKTSNSNSFLSSWIGTPHSSSWKDA